MTTEVIVLDGGSSSGTSSLARHLQELLVRPWATLGVDDLLDALAPSLVGEAPTRPGRPPLVSYHADGTVRVDPAFRVVEAGWYAGVAAMARTGLGVILDEVLLGGAAAQRRLAVALDGLAVVWVGVRCDPAVAAAREEARSDRIAGMAASQATTVHEGVHYDVIVDTTTMSSGECARAWLAHLKQA